MKSKKTVFAAVLTLVLALSIVTVSATAASANVKKSGEPVNDPCIAAAEVSGECVGQPLEGFVKNLSSLSEQEKTALLADLAEIEKYENQINEIYSRMTDENEKRLWLMTLPIFKFLRRTKHKSTPFVTLKKTNDSAMKSIPLMKNSRRFSKETQSFGNASTMSMMKRLRQTSRI